MAKDLNKPGKRENAKAGEHGTGKTAPLETDEYIRFAQRQLEGAETIVAGIDNLVRGHPKASGGRKSDKPLTKIVKKFEKMVNAAEQMQPTAIGLKKLVTLGTNQATVESKDDGAQTQSKAAIRGGKLIAGPSKVTAGPSQVTTGSSKVTAGPSQVTTGSSKVTAGPSQVTTWSSKVTAGPSQVTTAHSQVTTGPSNASVSPRPRRTKSGPNRATSGQKHVHIAPSSKSQSRPTTGQDIVPPTGWKTEKNQGKVPKKKVKSVDEEDVEIDKLIKGPGKDKQIIFTTKEQREMQAERKQRKKEQEALFQSEDFAVESDGENEPAEFTDEEKRMFIMRQVMNDVSWEISDRHQTEDKVSWFNRQIIWECKHITDEVLDNLHNLKGLEILRMRLNAILTYDKYMAGMTKEMYKRDMYYYYRLYAPCLQEFVEAYALITLIQYARLVSFKEIYGMLHITQKFRPGDSHYVNVVLEKNNGVYDDPVTLHTQIPITKTDYYLGLLDVPGQLVNACLADMDKPEYSKYVFETCAIVRGLHQCFSKIFPLPHQMTSKMRIMHQNLTKLESMCYQKVLKRNVPRPGYRTLVMKDDQTPGPGHYL